MATLCRELNFWSHERVVTLNLVHNFYFAMSQNEYVDHLLYFSR